MTQSRDAGPASTPAAAQAVAQTTGADEVHGAPAAEVPPAPSICEDGPLLEAAESTRPYRRNAADPLYRPLRIYAVDPGGSRGEGNLATVQVPFEPLEPGPKGAVFFVDTFDEATGQRYPDADLDRQRVLIEQGFAPTPSDPRFHCQAVYAIASLTYASFQTALGRDPAWGFVNEVVPANGEREERRARLILRPFAGSEQANAAYDETLGEVRFGYFQASANAQGRNFPGSYVFNSLSHDVVVHEVTHALLDGQRACFNIPTGPDVLGFHEGFADLVAVFQKFSYRTLVESALRSSAGRLSSDSLLTRLAQQFGQTTTGKTALRCPVEPPGAPPMRYRPDLEEHELGTVFASAVFDAFATIFERKTSRYVRLATGRSSLRDADAELQGDLLAFLATEASRLAAQFTSILIRAVDYCPPVDLHLGEFLRAVITADRELVPDDPWGYREAWIDAFARRGIVPPNVSTLSEESLAWEAPEGLVERIDGLSFARLHFAGDPARAAGGVELRRQSAALGAFVSAPHRQRMFGITAPGALADRPQINSIRTARRIGPDGQVLFDLVAEITQRQLVDRGAEKLPFWTGSTIVIGPEGDVRYVIWSRGADAAERAANYLRGRGRRFWRPGSEWKPQPQTFGLLHRSAERPPVAGAAPRRRRP